jgi:hypothetical protein
MRDAATRPQLPDPTRREPAVQQPSSVAAVADRVLTAGDVEAIADAIASKLAEVINAAPTTFALVDARQLARDLGVSLPYVYSHATELGAMRLGAGPKARIRFDLARARQALEGRAGQRGRRRRR